MNPQRIMVDKTESVPTTVEHPPTDAVTAGTAAPTGLTSGEAAERRERFGSNAISEHAERTWLMLVRRFWGVIPWMLEAAIVIDLGLGRWVEAGVIAALLVFNGLLGFMQEGRAKRALALLRQRLTVNARVNRDGGWQTLPASSLVPGDLLHVRVGDVIPADIRLTDGLLSVDQSQLTGESLPVEQGPGSAAYSGSLVSRGEASGIVAATGSRTYYGKTAELVRLAAAPARIEHLIVDITKYLGVLLVLLATAVVVSVVIRGMSFLDTLPVILVLLIGAVPIALPAMFTMSAALGARMLAQSGILVTRLSAIEDAAAMDVLLLDKTGTLTANRLAVAGLAPSAGTAPDELLRIAALASDAATQDPIDLAILDAAATKGLLADAPERLGFRPFDPSLKRSETSVRENGDVQRMIKGEPSTVAGMAGVLWGEIADDVARLSVDGSRVLAVAAGTDEGLRLVGFVALSDPPRPDSATLITALRSRGVKVLLVSGDGEATAKAIAAKVGITGEVAPFGTIHENVDAGTLARFSVFPRVFPQDKFFLVQALQKAGHVVGMTGDGVNDAPALRQADVGIAVANATDVAKAAASLVLTKPGLAEIVMAVEGSRRIYQRMRTFILTMNTRKTSMPTFIGLAIVLLGWLVVTPVQMVLLMFATDFATMAVSTDHVTPSPQPDRWAARPLVVTSLGLGALLLASSAAILWATSHVFDLTRAESQTAIFLWLVFAGSQAVLYLTRAPGFVLAKPYPARWLAAASLLDIGIVSLLAAAGWLVTPVPLDLIGEIFLLSLAFLAIADLLKVALLHRSGRRAPPDPRRNGPTRAV